MSAAATDGEQDTSTAFHGSASEKLVLTSGVAAGTASTGRAAVANRGLGNEGLYFEGGKEYEGYFFAKAARPTTLVLSIEYWNADGTSKAIANTTIVINNQAGYQSKLGDWQMVISPHQH